MYYVVFNAQFNTLEVLSLNKTLHVTIFYLLKFDNSPFTKLAVMGGRTKLILSLLVGCG